MLLRCSKTAAFLAGTKVANVLQSTSESPLAAITHLKKICGHVLICMKPGYDNINNDFTDVSTASSYTTRQPLYYMTTQYYQLHIVLAYSVYMQVVLVVDLLATVRVLQHYTHICTATHCSSMAMLVMQVFDDDSVVFEESWGGAARATKAAAAKPAKWTLDAAVTPQELMAQSDKLTVAMQLLQDLHSEGHRCAEQAQCSELQTETVEVQNDCV
jgi:hypothetical protein